jgi:hypothetical protein
VEFCPALHLSDLTDEIVDKTNGTLNKQKMTKTIAFVSSTELARHLFALFVYNVILKYAVDNYTQKRVKLNKHV